MDHSVVCLHFVRCNSIICGPCVVLSVLCLLCIYMSDRAKPLFSVWRWEQTRFIGNRGLSLALCVSISRRYVTRYPLLLVCAFSHTPTLISFRIMSDLFPLVLSFALVQSYAHVPPLTFIPFILFDTVASFRCQSPFPLFVLYLSVRFCMHSRSVWISIRSSSLLDSLSVPSIPVLCYPFSPCILVYPLTTIETHTLINDW